MSDMAARRPGGARTPLHRVRAGRPSPTVGRRPQPHAGPATAVALAARYAERLLLGTVRDVHHAVARRVFTFTGPAGLPTRLVHDAVSGAVYGTLGAGLRATGTLLERADPVLGGPPMEDRRLGRLVVSAVNGLIGESLDDDGHPLTVRMAARRDGSDVTDLAAAYPRATGDVVVFLHGLCENDESWRLGTGMGGGTYAARLEAETDWTPVVMRYNTGLPVARNGELLHAWLTRLLLEWPVPVRRLALVGHSMGGLVTLAACHHGAEREPAAPWTERVRHVVCLGTPHLGAPLEQLVYWGARALSVFPESSPFAAILNTRSAGILDLREGAAVGSPLAGAEYHCFSGSLKGPLGVVLGDLLVRRNSATGRIPGATSQHLPDTHHFRLLNHPEVYADLRRRLTA
jgi:pimeloyl-ACP methyl ester carboxylesterase